MSTSTQACNLRCTGSSRIKRNKAIWADPDPTSGVVLGPSLHNLFHGFDTFFFPVLAFFETASKTGPPPPMTPITDTSKKEQSLMSDKELLIRTAGKLFKMCECLFSTSLHNSSIMIQESPVSFHFDILCKAWAVKKVLLRLLDFDQHPHSTSCHCMASQGRKSDMCAVVAASAANALSKHCPHPPTSNKCGLSK